MGLFTRKEDWYASPVNALKLAELFKDPVLKEALTVLLNEQAVRASNIVTVPVPETGALAEYTLQNQAYTAGYLKCLQDFESLATTPTERKLPEPKLPWAHMKHPEQE